jgi:NAD(P)-dependent dehydrogenase (short-subunit alcohol dehydrogenase family)
VAGRAALVTGAGRGIGRATALALAGRGDRVLAAARTESDLRALADEAPVQYVVADLSTSEGCARLAGQAAERLGPVDILVNNAGIDVSEPPIWEHDQDTWRRVMAVNLDAPFELTRLLAGEMVRRRWGRIVMVSSTAGAVGGPAMAAYTTSKHAIIGLMRSVAQDVIPHGVTCNAVSPGWVRTSMAEQTAEHEAAQRGVPVAQVWTERAALYAAGRVVAPEEVAAVIAFLTSDAAAAVNGENVTVALGGVW